MADCPSRELTESSRTGSRKAIFPCCGRCEKVTAGEVPVPIDSSKSKALRRPIKPPQILYVGLTGISPFETGFIRERGIARLRPENLASSPEKILEWVRASGAKKVAVHFDVDVLAPSLYGFLLLHQPDAAADASDDVRRGCPHPERRRCRGRHRGAGHHRIPALGCNQPVAVAGHIATTPLNPRHGFPVAVEG